MLLDFCVFKNILLQWESIEMLFSHEASEGPCKRPPSLLTKKERGEKLPRVDFFKKCQPER